MNDPEGLFELSLEELMNVKVTSASKKSQRLYDVSAAMYVISSEDLRRSGARSIADALRMVPGMHVARIDANEWAVSSRGFNGRFANKMLVLIDGRTNYASLFSGVYWESMDILLDDIDRIEVIRGPGATVWGANAVNGVVNIITKDAKETQGFYLSTGYGNEERGFASLRYGHRLSDRVFLRLFGKYFNRDSAAGRNGLEAADSWDVGRAGFRLDWKPSAVDDVVFIGDFRDGEVSGTTLFANLTPPYLSSIESKDPFEGQSLLGRWSHSFGLGHRLSLQSYWDHYRPSLADVFEYEATVFDVELVHQIRLGRMHDFVSGVEYRSYSDKTQNSFVIDLEAEDEGSDLFSAFFQYEIRPTQEKLIATLGSKFEHHRTSQWEVQPNVRLLYKASDRHSFWAAASRAVRTPARAEESANLHVGTIPPNPAQPGAPATVVSFTGNPDFRSEQLQAFEIGYRSSLRDDLHLDVATFYNFYDDLRDVESGTPTLVTIDGAPYILFEQLITNGMKADTRGVEVALDIRPAPWCRVNGSYSYLDMKVEHPPTTSALAATNPGKEHPKHLIALHSAFDPLPQLDLDLGFRFVDEIVAFDIDPYLVADARAAWTWNRNLTFAVVGRDLFKEKHSEFNSYIINTLPTDVESSVYALIEWRP
jgi:iron complex outermembrane receptor protein